MYTNHDIALQQFFATGNLCATKGLIS